MIRLTTLLLAGFTTATWSGTATSEFAVRMTVSSGAQKCTSETLVHPRTHESHERTAQVRQASPAGDDPQRLAVVTVVCNAGNFVRIDPAPGRVFVGSSQGTFRYRIGAEGAPGAFMPRTTPHGGNSQVAVATVAGFSLVGELATDNRYELLISF